MEYVRKQRYSVTCSVVKGHASQMIFGGNMPLKMSS